jgi:murein L,D-transpeptidase YafK
MRHPRLILFLAGATLLAAAIVWADRRMHGTTPPVSEGERRIREARRQSEGRIRDRLCDAMLPYPPREIFLRAFKHEGDLELWAREKPGPFKLVHTWRITAASGVPGPKRREGDRQVPEGFYMIDRFNPESLYHLSLGLNYPNASDRIRSDPQSPGGDIFIHGRNVTIGCLPLGDPAIEELFLLALDTQKRRDAEREIPVHIFPARLGSDEWASFASGFPAQTAFWDELRAVHDYFERTRELPRITIDPSGRYTIAPDQPR